MLASVPHPSRSFRRGTDGVRWSNRNSGLDGERPIERQQNRTQMSVGTAEHNRITLGVNFLTRNFAESKRSEPGEGAYQVFTLKNNQAPEAPTSQLSLGHSINQRAGSNRRP